MVAKIKLPTIPARDALLELRDILKEACRGMEEGEVEQGWDTTYLQHQVTVAHKRFQAANAQALQLMGDLEEAVEMRSRVRGRKALAELRQALSQMQAMEHRGTSPVLGLPAVIHVSSAISTGELLRLNQLAQCLPTVEGLPNGRAENTLRAVIAVLRQYDPEAIGYMTGKGVDSDEEVTNDKGSGEGDNPF